jgi:DNA-binding CsgD family transcriptional regulator
MWAAQASFPAFSLPVRQTLANRSACVLRKNQPGADSHDRRRDLFSNPMRIMADEKECGSAGALSRPSLSRWRRGSGGREAVAVARSLSSSRSKPYRDFGLTPRQLEVVLRVVGGLSNKEIARTLSLSEGTIKHHLTNIYDKTGVSNRLEVALLATRHGLV